MTNEELCDALRNTHPSRAMCKEAADTLERLRDAADNLLIAIGMGWDLYGCVENLRAALVQSNAEPFTIDSAREQALSKAYVRGFEDGRAQSDAGPTAWPSEEQKLTASIAVRNYCIGEIDPNDCDEIVGLVLNAISPPRPDASAKDVATKIASRPALAKLIDTGALQFSEMCDLRDDIEKALRSRPDASAGLIEAAELAEECASECLEDRKAPLSAYALCDLAKILRACAADRSRK